MENPTPFWKCGIFHLRALNDWSDFDTFSSFIPVDIRPFGLSVCLPYLRYLFFSFSIFSFALSMDWYTEGCATPSLAAISTVDLWKTTFFRYRSRWIGVSLERILYASVAWRSYSCSFSILSYSSLNVSTLTISVSWRFSIEKSSRVSRLSLLSSSWASAVSLTFQASKASTLIS